MKKSIWTDVDAVVKMIPKGRWASYGDVAVAGGLTRGHAKALGRHLADSGPHGVWRVLTADGRPSPQFRIEDTQLTGDIAEVISWLKDEGVRFDEKDRARDHCRLELWQLKRLLTR